MDLNLKDTVAIVTGANGRIGTAVCEGLAREGATVIATDIAVETENGSIQKRVLDVTDEKAWLELIQQVRSEYGRLDILVNNAGICPVAKLEELALDVWRRCHSINVEGTFLGIKSATPLLRESGDNRTGGAAVVNIASTAADRAPAFSSAYSSSKAAVAMLTKAAAIEFAALGYKIRVNSVHPGAVESAMMEDILNSFSRIQGGASTADLRQATASVHPMGRFVEPAEVASSVVFLASSSASYIHGEALHVDGGYSAA